MYYIGADVLLYNNFNKYYDKYRADDDYMDDNKNLLQHMSENTSSLKIIGDVEKLEDSQKTLEKIKGGKLTHKRKSRKQLKK